MENPSDVLMRMIQEEVEMSRRSALLSVTLVIGERQTHQEIAFEQPAGMRYTAGNHQSFTLDEVWTKFSRWIRETRSSVWKRPESQ